MILQGSKLYQTDFRKRSNEAIPRLESLLRTAVRMSGDHARAEDAVQET